MSAAHPDSPAPKGMGKLKGDWGKAPKGDVKGKSSYIDKGGKSKGDNTTKGNHVDKGGDKGKDFYQKGKTSGKDGKGNGESKGGSHGASGKGYKGGDDTQKGKTLKGDSILRNNNHGNGKGNVDDEEFTKGGPKGKAKGKGKDKRAMPKGSEGPAEKGHEKGHQSAKGGAAATVGSQDQQVEVDGGAGGKDCSKGDANQQPHDGKAKGKTKAGGKDNNKGGANQQAGDGKAKGKTKTGGIDYSKGDANQQTDDGKAKGKTKAGGKDYGKYYKGKKGKLDDDEKIGMKGKRKSDQDTEAMVSSEVILLDDSDNDDLSFSFSYRPPRQIMSKAMPVSKESVDLPKSMPKSSSTSSSCSSKKRPLQTSPGEEHHGDASMESPQPKRPVTDKESCCWY